MLCVNRIKLFCFPYAGGSAAIFSKWKQYLDTRIDIIPIELAGRGKRIHEKLYKDINGAIEDVFPLIKKQVGGQSSYALFGHSMGGRIAYELAQKIRSSNLPQPLHIFLSGRAAPHVKRDDRKIYHLMDDDTFKKEVLGLGGTPPEFFAHPELLEIFLPLLKNDFRIAENGITHRETEPLDTNISVFLGKDEDLIAEECDGWKMHTKQFCFIYYFNGGHFFLHEHTATLVKLINNTLVTEPFVNYTIQS